MNSGTDHYDDASDLHITTSYRVVVWDPDRTQWVFDRVIRRAFGSAQEATERLRSIREYFPNRDPGDFRAVKITQTTAVEEVK